MMQVPCVAKTSRLHGLGVFATNYIKEGTVIWSFNPLIDRPITFEEFATLPKRIQDYVAHYSYEIAEDKLYVFCGDDGRYMNHSDNPNTKGVDSKDGYGITIAKCDIKPGEEITCDYREFDDDLLRKKTENDFV